jgi:alcohol dehydrogenase class IV
MNYQFMQTTKMISGFGSISRVGALLSDEGYRKAFLVYQPFAKERGFVDKVIASLNKYNIAYAEYDRVLPEPPEYIIEEGAQLCRREHCNCVVAIGGGSSIDTAKGINILMSNEGPILRFADPDVKMNEGGGLVSIPTTAGTGSELSNEVVVTDSANHLKVTLPWRSEFAIIDPSLSMTMSPTLTTVTGLDVFSHAMEAYTSVLSNDLADVVCEKIMSDVITYLPRAIKVPDDLEARTAMSAVAALGGWMLTNSCAHVGHSIAHVIGAKFHIPHGAACAYALPATLEFIAESVPEKTVKIGEILGVKYTGRETPAEAGEMAAKAYIYFRDSVVGLKPLSEYNCDLRILDECATDIAIESNAAYCPETVTKDKAAMLLEKVFA